MTPRRSAPVAALITAGALVVAGCADEPDGTAPDVLRIATVDNVDMQRMQELADDFVAQNPGVHIEFDVMGEGELRQRVTTDIAGSGGVYDVVTLGTYEVPIWADQEWLEPLDQVEGVDPDDLIPTVREALTHDGAVHALPFYGESSFTMYRTDLFEAAGLQMPDEPTWDEVLDAARELNDPDAGTYGMCLRGEPGWGENVALITSMANSYGGKWFDDDWVPQLDSNEWLEAAAMYAELGALAHPDTPEMGYNENLEAFRSGECAVWVDATAAGSSLMDTDSQVADSVGFAMAPGTGLEKSSNWLWAWSLAVPVSSNTPEMAEAFVSWATSPQYTELVAQEYGWAHVPPGTRLSLYENSEYLDAAPFAELTLASMQAADPEDPTVDPVPYTGVQYVVIPEFQGLGTAVGNRMALALSGEITIEEALENSQWVAGQVSEQIRFIQEDEQ